MIYAYDSILSVPILYSGLKERNYQNGKKFSDISMWFVGIMNIILALLGYFSYIDDTPELIIDGKIRGEINWPMTVAKGIIGITFLSKIAINVHP